MLFNPWPEILLPARKERGLSQENSADRAGVSVATWQRWETGRVHPGHNVFDRLARGVGLSPEELGLRYAQAMLRHYQSCAAPSPEPAGPGAGDARADDRRPAASEVDRGRPRPAMIRGYSADQGPLWIDLKGLFALLADHPSLSSTGPRPDEP